MLKNVQYSQNICVLRTKRGAKETFLVLQRCHSEHLPEDTNKAGATGKTGSAADFSDRITTEKKIFTVG